MLTSVTLPLLVFAASILLASGITVRLFLPRIQWGAVARRLAACGFGGTAALLAIGEFYVRTTVPNAAPNAIPATSLLVVAMAALVSGLFLSTESWWRTDVAVARQPILWGLLLATGGMAAWSYSQLMRASTPRGLIAFDKLELGNLHEIPDAYGETDLGRRIELLRYDADNSLAPESESDDLIFKPLPQRYGGVERAKPSDKSNCHGWIFTAGQHFVSGAMVPHILADNGYLPVSDPLQGDLIVYWDDDNYVMHTGLVRAKLDDGIIIIESKFGIGSRFLHMPEDQPYSANFAYYRTDRGGHLITIRNELAQPSKLPNTMVTAPPRG